MTRMLSSVLGVDWRTAVRSAPASTGRPGVWRAGLIAACALSIGLAAWAGHPTGYLEADPALAHLLRAMALIKGLIVLGALGAALWRYGWEITAPVAVGYAACIAVLAGSATLIWQLTLIPLAALMFHAALIGLVYVGWREGVGARADAAPHPPSRA
jgi:hypothetical protein